MKQLASAIIVIAVLLACAFELYRGMETELESVKRKNEVLVMENSDLREILKPKPFNRNRLER